MAENNEVKSNAVDKSGEEQLAYLGINPENLNGRVLELGSGKSEKLKEVSGLPDNCEIISLSKNVLNGIDPYINTLRKKPGWDKKTIQADALAIPFADETFDYVFSVDAIPHFLTSDVQIRTAFGEIWRILKSKGEARLFPVNERDLERAQDLFGKLGGNISLQLVNRDTLRKYGYFDKSAQRLIIKKP